jgi:sulfide dehydrogenase cytochrome subunit
VREVYTLSQLGTALTPALPQGEGVKQGRSMRLLVVIFVLLCAGSRPSGIGAAEPTALRGQAMANACAACHGPDGRSQGAIPAIDGLAAEDFVTVLKAFRAGTRQGTVMNRIARGLDDAEIDATAAYFAGRRGR